MPKKLKEIREQMVKLPRNPREYPRLGIKQIESRASPGIKSLVYKAVVTSEFPQEDPIDYVTFLQFYEMDYRDDKSRIFSVPSAVGRKILYHPKPNILKNPVSMKCSCPDFRFVWEFPLYEQRALIGQFRRYTRVPGSTRPPRNPEDHMGFCKHVWSLLNFLNKQKLVRELTIKK